jgi:hypothetical protein
MRHVARFLAMLASVLVGLVLVAPVAGAHTVSGSGATNFRTELGSLTPAVPGVEMKVIEAGSRLQLTNDSPTEVVVVGYTGEPYLRVGPDGVFQNRRSPATYLNANRNGTKPIPPEADATAEPDWEQISTGQVARWHDHRTHWMGGLKPPGVQSDPGRRQTVAPWDVVMRQGDTDITASGTIDWIPGPSPWPWYILAGVLGAGTVAALWFRRRSPWIVVAVVVALLVVIDVVHTAGVSQTLAAGLPTKLWRGLHSNLLSLFAWVAGVVAFVMALRRDPACQYPTLVTALIVALVGGVGDVTFLSSTTLPFAWPDGLARFLVTASLGLGFGLAAGLVLLAQRNLRAASTGPIEVAPAGAIARSRGPSEEASAGGVGDVVGRPEAPGAAPTV